VWSLGVVLYELLTGATPFRGDSLGAVIESVRSAPVPPVRAMEPLAPPELAAVAQRALSRDQGARYASAAALAEDVRAFLEGRQVGVYDYSPLELARLVVSRYRATTAVAGVGVVLLLAALVAVGLSNRRAAENLAEALVEKGRLAEAELRWDEAAAWYSAALAQAPRRDATFGLRLAWARTQASPITRLRGRGREVRALAASPDGRLLAAGGTGDAILVWDVSRQQLVHELRGHEKAVSGLAFLAGGAALLSSAEDGSLRRWPLDGGTPSVLVSRREPIDFANALAVSSDERWGAVAFERGDVLLVELATGAQRVVGRHESPVYRVAFRPDGEALASGAWGGDVREWEVSTGRLLTDSKVHAGAVLALAYSPNGTRLASAGRDTTVRVNALDHDGPDRVRVLSGHQQKVFGLAWSSDSKLLVSVSSDGTSRVWNGVTGSAARSASFGGTEDLAAVVFLPGTATVAWAGANGDVSLRTIPPQATSRTASTWEMQTLERAPDGRLLVPLLHGFGRLEPTTLEETSFIGEPDARGLGNHPAARLAISPDGALLVGTCGNDCLAWWDAVANRPLDRSILEGLSVERIDFSPDGRTLVTVDREGGLRVWNVATRTVTHRRQAHPGGAFGVAFSPDGRLVATAGYDMHIALWETAGFTEVARLRGHDHGVRTVAFSPDGTLLASASWDRTARVWNVAARVEVARLRHQDFVFGLDFRDDGAVLATASHDGTVRLWDTATFHEELRLQSDEARVTAVRFSKDGRALFYAGRGLHRLELESDAPLPSLDTVLTTTGLRLAGVSLSRATR
jgi:WD40 repeat protein